MAKELTDLSRMCMHTITTRPWDLETAAVAFSKAGIGGITVWRDALNGHNISAAGKMLRSLNLEIVSLCRGGFFPSASGDKRRLAIEDNLRAIDEAEALGAPMVVLVCGADAEQPLEKSREQILDGIAACLPHAAAANVKLTIEPLHPMYAGDRSAINTLSQANDMAEALNSPHVGIAADVYHLWWDPELEPQLTRAAKNGNLSAFHICDWKVPTLDFLNDRGLMGEGCINVPQIRGWVEDAGFDGYNEVEIFSTIYWQQDQHQFLEKIMKSYLEHA